MKVQQWGRLTFWGFVGAQLTGMFMIPVRRDKLQMLDIIKREKTRKVFHVCLSWIWWGVVMLSALPAGRQNGGTREWAVPTKSWNVRPEWNSCCTLCPDCLTACDSRENNRINNHSHTASLSLSDTLKDRETAALSATCHGLWIQLELSVFLSSPPPQKRGNFQQPDFEQWVQQPMGSLRRTEEGERAGGACGAKQRYNNERGLWCMNLIKPSIQHWGSWTQPDLRPDGKETLLRF